MKNLVSIIIIFYNASEYLDEAIASVIAQSYPYWELFLVDDGSTDSSTQLARQYAEKYQDKIFYLDHPEHQNRGKAISRNLGLKKAKGEYIAFLDADDIWLPRKLEQQIEILRSNPKAGMLYGDTLYWYSWTGDPKDSTKDFVPELGVAPNKLIFPPNLLPLFLRGKAAVPCTCSIIIKRSVAEEVSGFDETCSEINNYYEDQAFYAKICLVAPVIAMNVCWDKYRQRSLDSVETISKIQNEENRSRNYFLKWLDSYIAHKEFNNESLKLALNKELWLTKYPGWVPEKQKIREIIRWLKKWVLRLEELLLPKIFRKRFWLRN